MKYTLLFIFIYMFIIKPINMWEYYINRSGILTKLVNSKVGIIIYNIFGLNLIQFICGLVLIITTIYIGYRILWFGGKCEIVEMFLGKPKQSKRNSYSNKTSSLRFKSISFSDLLILIVKIPLALLILPPTIGLFITWIFTPKEIAEVLGLTSILEWIGKFYASIYKTIFI